MSNNHGCARARESASGDDAAWAALALRQYAGREREFTYSDADRAATVVEFLWNDMGEVRRLVEETTSKLDAWLHGTADNPANVLREISENSDRHTREDCTRYVPGFGRRFPPVTGSNVRPVTEGPLADPAVVDGVLASLDGKVPAVALADSVVFRIQAGDPRFDPTKPVMINGYLFNPATKD